MTKVFYVFHTLTTVATTVTSKKTIAVSIYFLKRVNDSDHTRPLDYSLNVTD